MSLMPYVQDEFLAGKRKMNLKSLSIDKSMLKGFFVVKIVVNLK